MEPVLVGTLRAVIESFDASQLLRYPDGRHELRHFNFADEREETIGITEREASRLVFSNLPASARKYYEGRKG